VDASDPRGSFEGARFITEDDALHRRDRLVEPVQGPMTIITVTRDGRGDQWMRQLHHERAPAA